MKKLTPYLNFHSHFLYEIGLDRIDQIEMHQLELDHQKQVHQKLYQFW